MNRKTKNNLQDEMNTDLQRYIWSGNPLDLHHYIATGLRLVAEKTGKSITEFKIVKPCDALLYCRGNEVLKKIPVISVKP